MFCANCAACNCVTKLYTWPVPSSVICVNASSAAVLAVVVLASYLPI